MTLPELIALTTALVFAYPWAMTILPAPRSPMLLTLTTLALSVGGLTLGMMWLALLSPAPLSLLTLGTVGGLMALVFGVGAWRWLEAEVVRGDTPYVRRVIGEARRSLRAPLTAGAVVIVVVMGGLVLFNAGYWPFGKQDAIDIYAQLAKRIYVERALPVGEGLYEAYPMLVPLGYTYTHLVADSLNEYLARLLPAALAVGALGAAYALGRAMYGVRTGVTAALLLALAPTYTRWASAGYADLPAAFFFTMSALFTWRAYQTGRAREAALAGVMVGLAAWTKNSALILVIALPAWAAYTHWRPRLWPGNADARPVPPRHAALMLGAMALAAGPWYARNLLMFGVVMPETGWTWLAQRTLRNLAPFVTYPDEYFVSGLVFTAGVVMSLWWAARGRAGAAMLVIFAGPLFAAWWTLFSYEPRFLLLALPLIAVMGGRAVDAALTWGGDRLPKQDRIQWAMVAVLVLLALPAASKAVRYKDEILRDPLMGTATKHRLQTGPAFAVAAFLNSTAPAGARVLSTVPYVHYYAAPDIEVVTGTADQEGRFDYLVLGPEDEPAASPVEGDPLAEINGARIYEVPR